MARLQRAGISGEQGGIALARAAGFEEHHHGIRFSVINPGLTDAPILLKRPVPVPSETTEAMLLPADVAVRQPDDACAAAPRAHPGADRPPSSGGTRALEEERGRRHIDFLARSHGRGCCESLGLGDVAKLQPRPGRVLRPVASALYRALITDRVLDGY